MSYLITIFAFIFSQFVFAEEPTAEPASLERVSIAQPYVTFVTNKGDFILELNPERAPITVANFLEYANSGYYKGTIFH